MNNTSENPETDYFSGSEHPEAFEEIKIMAQQVTNMPGTFKAEMLVSFLRDHSIKTDWLVGNDSLVRLITSGAMKMFRTERLFELNGKNKPFIADLENCIRGQLSDRESQVKHWSVVPAVSYVKTLPWHQFNECASPPGGNVEWASGWLEQTAPAIAITTRPIFKTRIKTMFQRVHYRH